MGLAQRAGRLAVGTHAVKLSARRGDLHAAVVARDATDNALDRVLPLLVACEVPVAMCGTAAELGSAVGRSRLVVAGLQDAGLAERVLIELPPMERTRRKST